MKTNKELGERVREHLIKKGVETPIVEYGENIEKRMTIVEENFTRIMLALGLDLKDDSLKDTNSYNNDDDMNTFGTFGLEAIWTVRF